MAEKEIQLAPPAPEKTGRRKLVILVVAVATSLLLAGGATAYFTGLLSHQGKAVDGGHEKPAPEVKRDAHYVPIDPPFTVNLQGGTTSRYFQTTVELLTREPEAEAAVKRHLPIIRDNLVMLFSSKEVKDLSTAEGRERLRGEALASIRKVLEAETGKSGIEQVFFTSFVMQ